jgi:hypothetical protein
MLVSHPLTVTVGFASLAAAAGYSVLTVVA